MKKLLSDLKRCRWYANEIRHVREMPPKPAHYGHLARPFPEPIARYLDRAKINLYAHQVEAITQIRKGENIVLATPTASGKSLAFHLPILEVLYKEETATALYLYPLKALARDQLATIRKIEEETQVHTQASIYDGDTEESQRSRIRKNSRVILSNPDTLHWVLRSHSTWEHFFTHLRFVVMDEAHAYRGVFGAHVAMVVRRLCRILDHYGAAPQFILASATIANPDEHATRLTGKETFTVVKENGAPQGPKHFVLWDSTQNSGLSCHRQASNLLAFLARRKCRSLCFTVSRKMAELVAKWAEQGAQGSKIVAYRAGYTPEERRIIEEEIKSGKIDAVATTNALEMGINIGQLDAVIIAGYPGTIISTWQQAGRAGRGTRPALVILVAFEGPLDQYLIRHPDMLFAGSPEHAVIDLTNDYILSGHTRCAAAEFPIAVDDKMFSGPQISRIIEGLPDITKTLRDVRYSGTRNPHKEVEIRGVIDDRPITIQCDGKNIEILDQRRAFISAHQGAVYVYQKETYVVACLDLDRRVATMHKRDVDYWTEACRNTEISINEEMDHKKKGTVMLAMGKVRVKEHVLSYKVRHGRNDKATQTIPLDFPPIDLDTVAFWVILPDRIRKCVCKTQEDWMSGLHAAEHALIHMMPFLSICDSRDVGGFSTDIHPETQCATIFVYDGYRGGIGIAQKGYEMFPELVKITHALVRDCRCEDGCPACIYDRHCGNNNDSLSRRAAVTILAALCDAVR